QLRALLGAHVLPALLPLLSQLDDLLLQLVLLLDSGLLAHRARLFVEQLLLLSKPFLLAVDLLLLAFQHALEARLRRTPLLDLLESALQVDVAELQLSAGDRWGGQREDHRHDGISKQHSPLLKQSGRTASATPGPRPRTVYDPDFCADRNTCQLNAGDSRGTRTRRQAGDLSGP